MDSKAMGKKINRARKDRGLTSEALSELCYISPTYLRQIEAGSKVPSMSVFITICKVLKTSPTYFLSDMLEDNEAQGIAELAALWKEATPTQIKLITTMTLSALNVLKENEKPTDE